MSDPLPDRGAVVPSERRRFLQRFLIAFAGAVTAACDRVSRSSWGPKILDVAEVPDRRAQQWLVGQALAQEFSEADISPFFRSNGTADPDDEEYRRLASDNFKDWKLRIDGLVRTPMQLSLARLRAMQSREQITRHDCVEGWSAIAKWRGVPLHAVLALVQPLPTARYAVFYCADPMDDKGTRYYESVSLSEAYHPQTILAYELNGKALPIANGAPLRVRVERQLGYKMAKYLMRLQLVDDYKRIGGGNGGYWEDQGYEWYAGI